MKPEETKPTAAETKTGAEDYPGVAINIADDNRVDTCLEKERTKTLNNNARNDDDKQ